MRRTLGVSGCLVVVALVTLASGCGGSSSGSRATTGATASTTRPDPTAVSRDALYGRAFVVQRVEGRTLAAGDSIQFSFSEQHLTVDGACNTLLGPYEALAHRLRWYETPTSTLMACDKTAADQDAWLSTWLVHGVHASLAGDTLTLRGDGVTMVLADQNSLNETIELVGPTWTLMATADGSATSSLPAQAKAPTLSFAADGTVAVFAGCNTGSASYEAAKDGSTITFGPLALTRMACPPPAGDVEAAVTAVLDGTVRSKIDGNTLTLTKGARSLRYRVG